MLGLRASVIIKYIKNVYLDIMIHMFYVLFLIKHDKHNHNITFIKVRNGALKFRRGLQLALSEKSYETPW